MKIAHKSHQNLSSKILVMVLASGLLASCAKVDLGAKKGGTTTKSTTTTSSNNSGNSGGQDPFKTPTGQTPGSVAGDWNVGFQFETRTLNSKFHIEQNGQKFSGTGTDDQDGTQFVIENGTINNGQVKFFKKYQGHPPIEYSGKIEIQDDESFHGPYMSGDYSTAVNGKIISNIWEAQMVPAGQQQSAQAPEQNQGPPPDQGGPPPGQNEGGPPSDQGRPLLSNWPVDRAPHLSGKWDVGYEYNFKTVRSSMFIEQEGDRITGHGVDMSTKEKFVIKKGWYHYPKVTIVREYTKGKNQASSTRSMTFKASVTFVNDKDYQGPYMQGKTQGGGNWEAQRVE
ncbi:MAG TPA: hypothetical protein V6C76_05910 [Drouetiella sp.]